MRKSIVFIIMALAFNAFGQADAFNKAVLDINAKNYSAAIEQLEILTNAESLESPELYYNLGYAHYHNGDIASAILALERALQIDPKNVNAKTMLSVANEDVTVQVTKIADFVLWEWYQGLIKSFSADTWAILQLFFLMVFVVLLYFILLKKKDDIVMRSALMGSLLLGLLCMHLSSARQSIQIAGSEAIFMASEGYINEGADDRSPAVAALSAGVKLYILDQVGEWYKVQLEDKDVGWVQKEKVDII